MAPPDPRADHLDVDQAMDAFEAAEPAEARARLRALARRTVAHLRSLSPEVEALYREVEAARAAQRPPAAYSAAYAAAERRAARMQAQVDADRRTAAEDLNRLLATPAADRLQRVETALTRFRGPALVDRLLEHARGVLRRDPHAAYPLYLLAEAVAHRVNAAAWGEDIPFHLTLRALAHRANALRVLGELPEADRLWQVLESRLGGERPFDLDLDAELLSLEASLRQVQRDYPRAERLLHRAYRRWETMGQTEGAARALSQLAGCKYLRGLPRLALPVFQNAAGLLKSGGADELRLSVQHALATCLCDLGRPDEAAEIARRSLPLYRRFPGLGVHGPRTWLLARIARAQGRLEEAEAKLLDARNRYLSRGLPLDAALVGLDLAELYLEQGRAEEVKRLAAAMVEVFDSRRVAADAARAARLLHQAAAARRVTPDLLGRLRGYFTLAQANPHLPFEAGA